MSQNQAGQQSFQVPPQQVPGQKQDQQPGREHEMSPRPQVQPKFPGAGKLTGKKAFITGGDSGIGRAVALCMAREGADIMLLYLNEHQDAEDTKAMVEKEGVKCVTLAGDVGDEKFCINAVEKCVKELGGLDILVNNAAEQHSAGSIEEISSEQMERTFRTNIFSMFYLVKAALKHMPQGGSVINTDSVVAFRGSDHLLDYSATKGAIFTFTRSLAQQVAKRGIRVNCVAPGPIWTPLIPATFEPERVEKFGKDTLIGRPGQPNEVSPAFVFLASDEASYITGQVIHVDGGEMVGA
jgi:NAD(P)-dependent dehydrogenase (short-subunit alcohol dehydrogenase family)